ncbi:MAG: DUF2383 domain-containing protein [Chitinivibrionales bacterium]|nr:DUF2383 domain-containing protein [Chitinivibrionales bacterium]
MKDKEIAEKIGSLIKLDTDAVHAYRTAIKRIENSKIHDRLDNCRNDHQRHIDDLSAHMQNRGWKPPRPLRTGTAHNRNNQQSTKSSIIPGIIPRMKPTIIAMTSPVE